MAVGAFGFIQKDERSIQSTDKRTRSSSQHHSSWICRGQVVAIHTIENCLYPPGIKHGNEQSPINEGFIRKTCAKTKKIHGELSTAMGMIAGGFDTCSFPKKSGSV